MGLSGAFLAFPFSALAFCPLCVVATGVFTGLFRWLGVDDVIVGLWLGGFTLSTAVFFSSYLFRKTGKNQLRALFSIVFFYVSTIFFLFISGSLIAYNNIWGVNKIIIGMILGGLIVLMAPTLDKFLRKTNQGKMFVSHQKVLAAVGSLLSASLIFYLVIR